ncbi:MAG: LysR family transcriptional regulator [Solirubrobacteraceae bacterium]|jgi:DNA-binding transcriptional LysR family regulator
MNFKRRQLDYFVTVADEGQITRAARKLQLAQPALSQAIAQLELDLGFKLLERHARGVTLTPAGEIFLVRARAAVAAWADAAATARSLARACSGTIEFGFVGVPPTIDSPEVLEMFSHAHPEIDLCYRELPFPSAVTSAWLGDVDVVVCHSPPADPRVWVHVVRSEPRMVLAPRCHPLAEARELSVADVLDETFIGFHPSVEPAWAGFWSLDDHRGARPRRSTPDGAANPHEVLAALAARRAITTVPAAVAGLIPSVLTEVVAIPLRDAGPATIALVGHQDRANPLVESLRTFARGAGARQRSAERA